MGALFSLLGRLQKHSEVVVASSDHVSPSPSKRARLEASSSGPSSSRRATFPQPKQINNAVFEVHKPSGRPSVEVVFFHGLQLERTDEPYLTTWVSEGASELWLNWIVEKFPQARIVTISYDASLELTDKQGRTDMYLTCESLFLDLVDAQVGQHGCPVVLVGHCLGGLVMKEICVKAQSHTGLNPHTCGRLAQNLLHNVKGLFSYGTPHLGSTLADDEACFLRAPLFEDMSTQNAEAQRRNEEFRKLRIKYKWKTFGVTETRPTTLGQFSGLVVAEASARYDVDDFYPCNADHFGVCKPKSRKSSNFGKLLNFIREAVLEDEGKPGPQVVLSSDVVGVEDQINELREQLKTEKLLGIVGMGGIGKSTLAKSLYNTISGEYEYTCFLGDVKIVMGRDEDPDGLRAKIIESLFHRGRKVNSDFQWRALEGKAVLIVLDDVDSEYQVLGMEDLHELSDVSRVVVTSRDKGCLIPKDYEFHVAEGLGSAESEELFCLHAFKKGCAAPGYEERVGKFIKKCDGFPLALEVAGKYLYKRGVGLWDDAFENLGRGQPINGRLEDGLFSVLRVCYDSLAVQEKEMFLDVAMLFNGEDLEDAKEFWRVCGWPSPDSGWENLVDRGFVTIDEDGIQMHEVLRDLGGSISRDNGGTRLAYHLRGEVTNSSRNRKDGGCDEPWVVYEGKLKVKSLMIAFHRVSRHMDLSSLRGFNNLRVLRIIGPADFESGLRGELPKQLRYLGVSGVDFWSDCSNETSSSAELQRNLALGHEELDLVRGTADCHQNLHHLHISFCTFRDLPNSLGQLQALEHLHISCCYKLESLPDSLGQLQALEHLHISGCDALNSLPDSLGQLQALEHLHISNGHSLKLLPDSLGKLRALRHLHLSECVLLTALPDTLDGLQALERLHIFFCHRLKSLPPTLGGLQALEHLHIVHCDGLTQLPDTLANLCTLEIVHCYNIRHLPDNLHHYSWVDGMEYIRRMRVRDHIGSEWFTYCSDDQMCTYRFIKYRGPPDFRVILSKDTEVLLHIEECTDGKALLDIFGRFLHPTLNPILRDLGRNDRIHKTSELNVLLPHLRYLYVEDCEALEDLPESLGLLQDLRYLRLVGCTRLKALPDSIGQLQELGQLRLVSCTNLKTFPSSVGKLQNLTALEISGCHSLETLPDILGQLSGLRILHIRRCCRLRSVRRTLSQLQFLVSLEFSKCSNLESLRDSLELVPHCVVTSEGMRSYVARRPHQGDLLKTISSKVRCVYLHATFPIITRSKDEEWLDERIGSLVTLSELESD